MFKKLLKILLWLIGSGILLIVLTLAGFYYQRQSHYHRRIPSRA